jgi:hypothetical protein
MSTNREKARKSGGMKDEWKEYHGKATAAKSAQHPHSKVKSQKELKKITDSKEFKESGYHEGNKMLADAHPSELKGTYKKGGKVKRKNTSRENRLEELGRVDAEKAYSKKGKRNLKSEKKRIVRELHSHGGSVGSRGVAIKGFGKEIR